MTLAPAAFETRADGDSTLVVDGRRSELVCRAGLAAEATWRELLERRDRRSGRGATTSVELEDGSRLRLKQLRRGGLSGKLLQDRFVGPRRLMDNVSVPLQAIERGIRTPRPVALLIRRSAPCWYRGWLAVEELDAACDLAQGTFDGEGDLAALEAAVDAVRDAHDRGLEHRDLNLGNLLVQRRERRPLVHLIDLDRAKLHGAGLGFRARQRGLRRLERSYVKCGGTDDAVRARIYERYAGDDRALAARLRRGRWLGCALIALHRLTW